MAWPPRTAEYERAVKARGLVFIPQLPATTNLGPDVEGAPGARTVNTATKRSVYEIAPVDVQREMQWTAVKTAVGNLPGKLAVDASEGWDAGQKAATRTLDAVVTPFAEATGLDHGLLGAIAKAVGIPFSALVVVGLFLLYLYLKKQKVV